MLIRVRFLGRYSPKRMEQGGRYSVHWSGNISIYYIEVLVQLEIASIQMHS